METFYIKKCDAKQTTKTKEKLKAQLLLNLALLWDLNNPISYK